MPRFLFWNINGKNVADVVARLAEENSSDIVVLAECALPLSDALLSLNAKSAVSGCFFYAPTVSPSRTQIFVRYSAEFVKPYHDGHHITIRRVSFPSQPELLLAAVHLPSLLHLKDSDQDKRAVEVVRNIVEREQTAGHARTIVVGDFNMNPFSRGMIAADAFNAVGQRSIAKKLSRMVFGTEHSFFYNPMWRFFAEHDRIPSGTFYYNPSGYDSLYWHIFDQVLIRPDLIGAFQHDSLKILSSCAGHELLNTAGTKPNVSDHLPIAFNLQFS